MQQMVQTVSKSQNFESNSEKRPCHRLFVYGKTKNINDLILEQFIDRDYETFFYSTEFYNC